MLGAAHLHGAPTVAFVPLAVMWLAMMSVMMAPAAWAWVRTFHQLSAHAPDGRRLLKTASFVAGYWLAWLPYSAIAAFVQQTVSIAEPSGVVAETSPILAGGILAAAGLFQFAPAKRACLLHCRNPLSYFLVRWSNRPTSGFRLGLSHGIFCVACCWALMATALVVGLMNLWWMLALSAAAFAEQVSRRGETMRVGIGLALIFAGVLRVV